ncbi:MAG: YdbH domain-containing protein [Proteobacteria bacterium]|nr:YdbH domain-containing protein [Pseudomonadota bacterium]
MSDEAPLPPHRPARAQPSRLIWAAAIALVGVCALAVLARKPIAARLMEDALEQAGLSVVTLNVTQLNIGGVTIEDLNAENGALYISRIHADFTPWGLLRARIDALDVDKFTAALTWREDGFRVGDFRLRPRPDEPLTLPDIRRLSVSDSALTIATPSDRLQAPFSLAAETTDAGWRSTLKSNLTGQGVNVVLDWDGVITPADPAQSTGQGTLRVDIDGLAVPGITNRLDAKGVLTLGAGDGAFAVTVNEPLSFSFDAPPLGVQSLDTLPWSITIAPSASQAAFVLTKKGDARTLRFDVTAVAQVGNGRARFALAGSGAQMGNEIPRFELSNGKAEVTNLPVGGGTVSGVVNLSNIAGTIKDAQGRIEATANVSDVTAGETVLGRAQASFESVLRIVNGTATLNLQTLQADVSRATFAGWTLAAPAHLGLAANGREQALSFGVLSGLAGNVALSLPTFTLQKDGAAFEAEAPDINLTAKGLDLTLTTTRVALRHPALEIRDGRLDATYGGGKLAAQSTLQVVRLGPPTQDSRAQTGVLTATSALTARNDNLDVNGTLTAASGAALGTFKARIGTKMDRGTATLSIPKKRFERGGKFDAADIGFITAVSDLTGTVGLEARVSWNGARETSTATATLDDVGFAVGDVSVAGLTTTIDLANLRPLRSAKPHHVTIQSITAGIPLANLLADVVLGDGTATVTRGSVDIAAGQITMTDAALPLDGREGLFALSIEKIDMAELSALAKVDGLSVTGTLSGTVPLRSGKTGLYFANGTLRADAPGKLVYKPAAPPEALAQNQGGSLLLQALSNFAYDRLSIALNGPVTEDIALGVSLAGRNPDLYGGYPIEFNLNLSGRLTQILRQGLAGYGVPTNIERQIREGQKTPGG